MGPVVRGAASFAKKHAGELIILAGMGYQAYENHQLENRVTILQSNISELKSKVVKVSSLLMNISNVEYETVEQNLNNLIEQQQLLLIEEEINNFAAAIQLLISNTQAKHQNIINIRPHKELQKVADSLTNQFDAFTLPKLEKPDDLFTINKVSKTITNDLITLTYVIPMVRKEAFYEYGIISIPSSTNVAIVLNNGTLVQKIIINDRNTTSFIPNPDKEIFHNIYDNIVIDNLPNCERQIMNMSANLLEVCPSRTEELQTSKFFFLRDDLAVILKGKTDNITISCNDNIQENVWTDASLVDFPNCMILSKNHAIPTSLSQTAELEETTQGAIIDITAPKLIIQHLVSDPRLADLKAELENELSRSDDGFATPDLENKKLITIGSIILLLAVTLFTLIRKYRRRTIKHEQQHRNPAISDGDRIPDSWVQDWFQLTQTNNK